MYYVKIGNQFLGLGGLLVELENRPCNQSMKGFLTLSQAEAVATEKEGTVLKGCGGVAASRDEIFVLDKRSNWHTSMSKEEIIQRIWNS